MSSIPSLLQFPATLKSLYGVLFLLASAFVATTASLQAEEDAARIMLKSLGDATIEVISHSDGSKLISGSGEKAVTLDQPTVSNEWSTASVTFKVNTDAEIQMRLSATWSKEDNLWVFIDNIKGEGIEIQNPDLESASDQAPAGWTFRQAGAGKATHISDASTAASGTGFVKLSHSCSLIQVIHVPKDKEVTISFLARSVSE